MCSLPLHIDHCLKFLCIYLSCQGNVVAAVGTGGVRRAVEVVAGVVAEDVDEELGAEVEDEVAEGSVKAPASC